MKCIKAAILMWAFAWSAAVAQGVEEGVIVTGEGRVSAAPDMATISLGVTQTAETAADVVAQVNGSVAAILKALRAREIADADLQTSGFYLQPLHAERRDAQTGQHAITGYRAGNMLSVQVRDLSQLGALMDMVIELGGNDFNGLRFGLNDPTTATEAARTLAVKDAMGRAAQLADAAQINLGSVTRLTEHSTAAGPQMQAMAMARSSMSEAIAGGEVDVSVQVTMVFSIAPDGL